MRIFFVRATVPIALLIQAVSPFVPMTIVGPVYAMQQKQNRFAPNGSRLRHPPVVQILFGTMIVGSIKVFYTRTTKDKK